MKTHFQFSIATLLGLAFSASVASRGSTFYYAARPGLESDRAISFVITRSGPPEHLSLEQSIDFFTQDGTARAGSHYVATSGKLVFASGQTELILEVPLIDNGQVDGGKSFGMVLTNPVPLLIDPPANSNSEALGYGGMGCGGRAVQVHDHWIRDNELPLSRVDPTFVPDTGTGWGGFLAVLPDNRIIVGTGAAGITVLQKDGRVDPGFVAGGGKMEGLYYPIYVFSNGTILTHYRPSFCCQWRFVRLSTNGAVDRIFNLPERTEFCAAEPDGSFLVRPGSDSGNQDLIYRVRGDGVRDPSFAAATFSPGVVPNVVVQPDGKILVGGPFRQFNGMERGTLVRLNHDGSIDETFQRYAENVSDRGFFVRADGKIIVTSSAYGGGPAIMRQLNSDGTIDLNFEQVLPLGARGEFLEHPDGRFLIMDGVGLLRLSGLSSADSSLFARPHLTGWLCQAAPRFASTGEGQVLFRSSFDEIDGVASPGLARLFWQAPRPDFRVIKSWVDHGSRMARVEVGRTGDSTRAAAVEFSAVDETAKQGQDYVPQSGTLRFAALEVRKVISVPLAGEKWSSERLSFKLELCNPSGGYAATGPVPISVAPEIRLTIRSEQSSDGAYQNQITVHGTVPGLSYGLDFAEDSNFRWYQREGRVATGSTMLFRSIQPSVKQGFFRVRRL